MGIEIKKQNRETTQSLVHRFTKAIRESSILVRVRKTRFKRRKKSNQMKKRAALRREELKKEYEKLRKLGKSK